MEYARAGHGIIIRLDEDDEIASSILKVCKKEGVKAASVSAIGAVKSVDLSHYDSVTKEYTTKNFEGMFEITSLSGNVSRLDGEPAAHFHITLGKTDLEVFGGHLVKGIVNPTCEIFIMPIEADVSRVKDEKTGLSLLRFK